MNTKPQTLTTATDNELLMRFVRAKDDECFEALVARHSNLVFQVCQTILSNQADAEDAFQATFLVLIRKAKCLQPIGSLAAWLYKVAYRIAVRSSQTRRRKSTSSIVEEPQSEIDQFHNISQKEILSEVYAELSLLPKKYKEVLVECYLEGKTYRQVADATDSNEIAVKGRLAQAKKSLEETFAQTRYRLVVCFGHLGTSPIVGCCKCVDSICRHDLAFKCCLGCHCENPVVHSIFNFIRSQEYDLHIWNEVDRNRCRSVDGHFRPNGLDFNAANCWTRNGRRLETRIRHTRA